MNAHLFCFESKVSSWIKNPDQNICFFKYYVLGLIHSSDQNESAVFITNLLKKCNDLVSYAHAQQFS